MVQLFLILIINVAFLILSLYSLRKKTAPTYWMDFIKHIGILEIAWATFSIMLGLIIMFSVLESVTKDLSFMMIAGVFNLMMLVICFGFGVLHFFISSILIYKVFRNHRH